MEREHVDKLYEPLADDELEALLAAVRHFHKPGYDTGAMSRAANKIEAQLHLSLTGHRIYEGPPHGA